MTAVIEKREIYIMWLKKILKKTLCKNEKIAVYTAITGDYDNLIDPKYIDDN